jgi:hypothetical protein
MPNLKYVYIFDVYHQHGQDKFTSTKHVLAGQLDYRATEVARLGE